ncbi:MAG: hypothetical protein ACK5XA_15655 [Tagaea sp.]
MSNRLRLVRGDTPQITVTLWDAATEEPIDIVGATPRLKFRRAASADPVTIVVGSPLPGREDPDTGAISYDSPYGTPGRGGRVLFAFTTPLLGASGSYEGEVEVTFPNGVVQTVYDRMYATVREQF